MKLIINQKDLAPIMAQAQTIVDKKTNSQSLTHVYLKTNSKNELELYATDLEVSLIANIPCEVQSHGVAAIPAQKFYELIRELDNNPIQLIYNNNHWLDIEQGKFKSKIKGLDPEEYPIFILNTPSDWFHISNKELKNLLLKTEFASSSDTARAYLNGVYIHFIDDSLSSVATDGHRLALFRIKKESKWEKYKKGIIIPKKGVNEIRKLLDSMGDNQEIEVTTDNTQLFVRKPGVILGIRLIDGNFPNYIPLIPKHKNKAQVNKNQLLTSIKRVALFSSLKSKAVTLGFNNESLVIQTMSVELGDAKDEIDIEYKGPEIFITYNPNYLIDALNHIDEDQVVFEFESSEKPTLIKGIENTEYLNIVMPMRV